MISTSWNTMLRWAHTESENQTIHSPHFHEGKSDTKLGLM